jgi:hypothetical protein
VRVGTPLVVTTGQIVSVLVEVEVAIVAELVPALM